MTNFFKKPPLRPRRADNPRAHQKVYASYDDARRRGRISQGEAQRFAAMDSRLIALRNELAGEGISLQDYQRIGSLIARDRATVEQMSRY